MGPEARELPAHVVLFIEEQIDSVPHLEALLLLWESGAKQWTVDETAARLYVTNGTAKSILKDLVKRDLVRRDRIDGRPCYRYYGGWDGNGERMRRIAETYRRQLRQVAALIHSKAPTAVWNFAQAFRIKKE
jgi:predicted ArsR family transcriptional regulator